MTFNDLKLRVRALLRPNRVEQELDEELAFHIEREARKLIDEGMTPAEARQRAQARFGSTALAADRCRDERGTAVIDNTIRDIQYALRTFAKAPLAASCLRLSVSWSRARCGRPAPRRVPARHGCAGATHEP